LTLQKSHTDIKIDGPETPVFKDSPSWSPNVPKCEECGRDFDFLTRRHHCRRCGRCLCSRCSNYKEFLLRMRYIDKVRQCHSCCQISELENANVKTLENLKKSSLMLDEQDKPCTVKLDEFLTEIQISAVGKQSKISLDHLKSANILTKGIDGSIIPVGFLMTTETDSFEFLLPENANLSHKKWLKSLQILFAFIFSKN